MKTTLVSIITSLTVIGSAFSAPSPEDRKTLCLKHPDKYVWVEKESACVPINPCESADKKIQDMYCVSIFEFLPHDTEVRDMVITRYMENIMHATVSEIKALPENYDNIVITIKTTDGGYYVTQGQKYPYELQKPCSMDAYPAWAGIAYGKTIKSSLWAKTWAETGKAGREIYYKGSTNAKKCQDIADFASLISGHLMTSYIRDFSQCVVFCPGEE